MIYEKGGAGRNSGTGQVVCGPNGEPLTPAWAPDRLYSLEKHAGFEGRDLIVVRATWGQGEITVEARRGGEDGEVVYAVDRMGRESVPGSPLRAAADAAIEKAQCYHCRCRHYTK